MTTLVLLRHAHAGDPAKWSGPDAARPLSDKGRGQAERLGRHLAALGDRPDAILSSPKVRALQTAELVAEALGTTVALDERLGGPLDLGVVEAILAAAGDPGHAILVGHDPDFSELVGELVGLAELPMRKGAYARLEVDRPLRPGTATLRALLPPDLLPG